MKLKEIKGYFITHKGAVVDQKTYGKEGKTLEMISVGNLIYFRVQPEK